MSGSRLLRRMPAVGAVGGSLLCLVLTLVFVVFAGQRADAAFPGTNGKIAFDDWGHRAWWANPGGEPVPFFADPVWEEEDLEFSPDGTRVVFEGGDEESNIYVANVDGTGLVKLVSERREQSESTEWIAGYEDEDEGTTYPWVKLTKETVAYNSGFDPAFAPDGDSVVIERDRFMEILYEVCAVSAEGDEECIPSAEPGNFSDEWFEFEGGVHLEQVDARTGARIGDLTAAADRRYDSSPTFSADGKLAFEREEEGGPENVMVIPSPGAPPITIGEGDSPDFSPDGSRIVFLAKREFAAAETISIAPATGGAATSISPSMPPDTAIFNLEAVKFSPDGKRLLFASEYMTEAGGSEEEWTEAAFTVDLAGNDLRRIATQAHAPAWQPIPIPAPAPKPVDPAPHPKVNPPVGKSKKKVRLSAKGKAVVGTVACGSDPCRILVKQAKLAVGKKRYAVAIRVPKRLADGKRAKVRLVVSGKVLAAVRAAGKGKLAATLRVSAAGKAKALKFKPTVTAAPAKKGG